jgi:cardiolipin synthase A/B
VLLRGAMTDRPEYSRAPTKTVVKRLALIALMTALVLLALIGALTVTRGTPVQYVIARGDPAGPPAVGDSLFQRIVALNIGTEVEPGNRVQVLHNGNQTYPVLWRDLRACRQTVTVQMYFAKPGAVADTMSALLRDCARRKVRVLVLLDAFGAQSLANEWVKPLRAAGVEVTFLRQLRWYSLHKAAERSHARVVVVDGRVGYTGGFGLAFGLADYWLGGGLKPEEWRETNVRFEGPAVAQLQAAFATAWAEATGELLTGAAFYPPAMFATEGTVRAGLFHAMPTSGSTPAERYLALTIAGAKRRLYIANAYFVPDDDFRRLLVQAARRGVDVRVLTTGPQTDVKSTLWAGRWRYEELLKGGVRIWEYQPANMHAKSLSADGVWGTVGSMNFDNRSLAFNDETNLLILDPGVVGAMDASFLADLTHSREITAAEMHERPWWQHVRDALAATMQRLL